MSSILVAEFARIQMATAPVRRLNSCEFRYIARQLRARRIREHRIPPLVRVASHSIFARTVIPFQHRGAPSIPNNPQHPQSLATGTARAAVRPIKETDQSRNLKPTFGFPPSAFGFPLCLGRPA
jgi:hypothetical protein